MLAIELVFGLVFVVFLGLVLGSFATALAYRLPRDISMITQVSSRCTACERDLRARDLVPVFSWLFLKGKCRYCRAPIGWQYPLIELTTLALCLLFYAVYGLSWETGLIFALAPVLVSTIDIDFRHKIIPDSLNLSIFLIGLGLLFVNAGMAASPVSFLNDHAPEAFGGSLVYGLGSLALRQGAQAVLKREAMGLGDIKFFAAAGFWLGLNPDAAAMLMIISGVSGTIMALGWKKATGEEEVPFGPSLIVAFIAVLCFFKPGFIGY